MMKKLSNKHQTPHPAYIPNDSGYLLSPNLSTNCPYRKLREKFLGPFKILERVRTKAYKLDLPPSMKVYPVFPVKLLKSTPKTPCPRCQSFASPLPSSLKAKKSTRLQKSSTLGTPHLEPSNTRYTWLATLLQHE